MTETAQLAFIATIRSWGELLIPHLHTLITALGAVVIGWWVKRAEHRAIERAEQAQAYLLRVEAVARRTKEEAALMATGAFHNGHVAGTEEATKRLSDFDTLRAQGTDTDTFLTGRRG